MNDQRTINKAMKASLFKQITRKSLHGNSSTIKELLTCRDARSFHENYLRIKLPLAHCCYEKCDRLTPYVIGKFRVCFVHLSYYDKFLISELYA